MLPDDYGCVVANRFGNLLDDDADPFDLINDAEIERDKKKKKEEEEQKRKKTTKQKKSGQKETQKDRRAPFADGPDPPTGHRRQAHGGPGGPGVTDGRGGALEAERGRRAALEAERGRRAADHGEFSVPIPAYNVDSEPRGRGGAGRGGRGRGGGGGGGGGGGRGGGRGGYFQSTDTFKQRGKREYERNSGSGVSPEEKRGGRGPWNWGSVRDTVGNGMDLMQESAVKPDDAQLPVEGEDLACAVDGEVVVQVAMQMSFEEWKTLQETSRPKAEFNLRKAESAVPSKARVIHQSKKLEKPQSDGVEDEGPLLRRSVNDITSRLDINFGSLGRAGRGAGRGRGRARRGGGAGSPEKESETKSEKADELLAPNPDDPDDFPALTARRLQLAD